MTEPKFTVAVDFDGVMNTYDGWRGEDELFEPRDGLRSFLENLAARYLVVVHTTRKPITVWRWLDLHHLSDLVHDVTTGPKPRAVAYVDDRAVRFDGDYNATLDAIEQPTHWERSNR